MSNLISLPLSDDKCRSADKKTQLEKYQVRFLYAAATLPDQVVDGFLELRETASESETNPLMEKISSTQLQ